MKKNFIYIVSVLVATLFSFSSCSDFLDRMPDDELSDGSFWKTPDDAKMFIGDVYRQVLRVEIREISTMISIRIMQYMVSNGQQGIFPEVCMTRQVLVGQLNIKQFGLVMSCWRTLIKFPIIRMLKTKKV